MASRMAAEMGATFVKTYYCEDFEQVTSICPVPVVIAGGKKISEMEANPWVFNQQTKKHSHVRIEIYEKVALPHIMHHLTQKNEQLSY
jgi:hypothetical protein